MDIIRKRLQRKISKRKKKKEKENGCDNNIEHVMNDNSLTEEKLNQVMNCHFRKANSQLLSLYLSYLLFLLFSIKTC